MLASSTLVGFVATADAAKAKNFYQNVLGLNLTSEDPFALMFMVGNNPLRVQIMEHVVAAPHTVLGWTVDDIEAMVDQLVGNGVVFERYEGMDQDERNIWTSPPGARIAWFKDPDGNLLSLTQPV